MKGGLKRGLCVTIIVCIILALTPITQSFATGNTLQTAIVGAMGLDVTAKTNFVDNVLAQLRATTTDQQMAGYVATTQGILTSPADTANDVIMSDADVLNALTEYRYINDAKKPTIEAAIKSFPLAATFMSNYNVTSCASYLLIAQELNNEITGDTNNYKGVAFFVEALKHVQSVGVTGFIAYNDPVDANKIDLQLVKNTSIVPSIDSIISTLGSLNAKGITNFETFLTHAEGIINGKGNAEVAGFKAMLANIGGIYKNGVAPATVDVVAMAGGTSINVVDVGGVFKVYVKLRNVQNLTLTDFAIKFDPSVIKVFNGTQVITGGDVTLGAATGINKSTDPWSASATFLSANVDNTNGLVKYAMYKTTGTSISTPETIFEITFKAVGAGNPNIHFATIADDPNYNATNPDGIFVGQVINDIATDVSASINLPTLTVLAAAKSNVTNIAIKTGSEAVVTAIDNSLKTLTVANATIASGLKTALVSTDSTIQTYAVTDASDVAKADGATLVTGDKLVVTAENGTTFATYIVTVSTVATLSVTSSAHVVDEANAILKGIIPNSKVASAVPQLQVSDFLTNLTPSAGASVNVYALDGTTLVSTGIVKSGMKVKVSAGANNKIYTVIIFGDVNGDGLINANDVLMLRRNNAFILTCTVPLAANVNHDANVNANDVLLLRRFIATDSYPIIQN